MKYLIASDIHGSAYYTEKLVGAVERESPDRIILLGDILYHGPRNDLPEGYAPKRVIEMLSRFADITVSVRGNCDTEVDQMVLPFPIMAELMYIESGGRLIIASHGHTFGPDSPPPMGHAAALLCGHTHIPACTEMDGFVYLNPGSVSIPKENSPHSYMIISDGEIMWKSLDGEEYLRSFLERKEPKEL